MVKCVLESNCQESRKPRTLEVEDKQFYHLSNVLATIFPVQFLKYKAVFRPISQSLYVIKCHDFIKIVIERKTLTEKFVRKTLTCFLEIEKENCYLKTIPGKITSTYSERKMKYPNFSIKGSLREVTINR